MGSRPRSARPGRAGGRPDKVKLSGCAEDEHPAIGQQRGREHERHPVHAMAWGSETRIRSRRGGVVLVDEPAEQISSANVVRTDGDRIPRFGSWRGEAEGAMRAPAVVVLGVGPERAVEMPPTSG